MQNDQMTIRGYSPQQNTGRMNTLPYQAPQQLSPLEKFKALWNQLDPAAVMLLGAVVLGFAYALYATISFWWLTKLIPHLILVWITVLVNGAALISGKRELMLAAVAGYVVSLLLFVNYFYLLLLQPVLCLAAWWKTNT